jgi:allene oxide cyclase-like protein
MKHARVTALAASVAAATLVTGVGAASAAASSSVSVLHLYERPGPSSFVNNGPQGKKPGRGDIVIYANPVFDRHGTRVGTDHGVCTVLSTTLSQCDATIVLPKGQIVTHGLQGPSRSGFDVAVIGGTGAYTGVHGTMATRPIKDGGLTILISLL